MLLKSFYFFRLTFWLSCFVLIKFNKTLLFLSKSIWKEATKFMRKCCNFVYLLKIDLNLIGSYYINYIFIVVFMLFVTLFFFKASILLQHQTSKNFSKKSANVDWNIYEIAVYFFLINHANLLKVFFFNIG